MKKNLPLLPGETLGMMGGGQLGRMFAVQAAYMGYHVNVLDPGHNSPAGEVSAHQIEKAYLSDDGLTQLAQSCGAVTTEFENVPAQALQNLSQNSFVAPPASCVAIAQDRNVEKDFISRVAGVPVAPNCAIFNHNDIDSVDLSLFPAILKTARLGYDGKGQITVRDQEQLRRAFDDLGQVDCILEKRLDLALEVSVIVARGSDGQSVTFPVCENRHENGILAVTVMPARISEELSHNAREAAEKIIQALKYVGVLCIEFFILRDGSIVANEMAPRPHNSGHATIDACVCSQYEQQVRTMTGMPLGDTTQHSAAVMLNILGDIWFNDQDEPVTPNWKSVLAVPGAKLHLYGKAQARRARKMGHITCIAPTLSEALERARRVAKILNISEP